MSRKEPVKLRLDFSQVESDPVSWSNYFLIQYNQGEFVLTVAQVPPPVLLGGEEEQKTMVQALGSVPVKPVARVVVSRAKLASLAELIARQLERFPASVVEDETEQAK